MPMNVQPIPTLDERINDIRMRTAADRQRARSCPTRRMLWRVGRERRGHRRRAPRSRRAARATIKAAVKKAGLWAPHLPAGVRRHGPRLPRPRLHERGARLRASAPASLFGVVAPNSGNQTILVKYGTEEQKQKWLLPLIDGDDGVGLLDDRARQPRLRPALARPPAPCATATSGSSTATSGSRRTASPPTSSSSCAACRTTPASRGRDGHDGADHRADRHARA